jgi:Transposase DDE domain
VVEAQGHPLNFAVSKANWHDHRALLTTREGIRIGKRNRKPKRLGLDKGYDREPLRRHLRVRRIIPLAPYRKSPIAIPLGRPAKDRHPKRYGRQRGTVERSFAWLTNARRVDRFLERDQKTYRAFLRVFFVRYDLHLLF